MMMPPDVFSSAARRRTTTRSCRGRNFTRYAPQLGKSGVGVVRRSAMDHGKTRLDIGRLSDIVSTFGVGVPRRGDFLRTGLFSHGLSVHPVQISGSCAIWSPWHATGSLPRAR